MLHKTLSLFCYKDTPFAYKIEQECVLLSVYSCVMVSSCKKMQWVPEPRKLVVWYKDIQVMGVSWLCVVRFSKKNKHIYFLTVNRTRWDNNSKYNCYVWIYIGTKVLIGEHLKCLNYPFTTLHALSDKFRIKEKNLSNWK